MKRTKHILCVLLAVLMVVPMCGGLLPSADAVYSLVIKDDECYTVAPGVTYSEYTLSSGIYADTYVDASALEFDVDDYLVMSYTGRVTGGVATLDEYYQMAVADGYEVVGLVNGSFFTMATGVMDEHEVVNGVLVYAENGNESKFDGMTVLTSDGKLSSVEKSAISLRLSVNGAEIKNMLNSVNVTAGSADAGAWQDTFYYFDSNAGTMASEDRTRKALTYEICPGYEIVCEKDENSVLSVGGTLYGTVKEIRENTYGSEIGENEFILFMRADSSNASVVESIYVGDEITISAEQMVEASVSATENAMSVFENPSYLVKDGVNLVADDSYNSKGYWHGNTFQARWTAFGVKEDGSWVFFTTEGGSSGSAGSATLQDVAKAMIGMGCVDVIRMDGGGSSGLYVCDDGTGNPGFKQVSTRNVVDCVMVVKRSSPALNTGAEELEALIAQYADKTGSAYTAAIAAAKEVLACGTSVSGDYMRAYRNLQAVAKAEESLNSAIALSEAAVEGDYSSIVWEMLPALVDQAKAVLGSDASAEEMRSAASALLTALGSKGSYSDNIALGKSYTASTAANATYPDTNGTELTDGNYSNAADGFASGWAGWNTDTDITVDLGEVYGGLSVFKVYALEISSWAVNVPAKITVSVSEDGTNYTEVGVIPDPAGLTRTEEGAMFVCTLALEESVSARYVKFATLRKGFSFLSEVEVIRVGEAENYAVPEVKIPVEGNLTDGVSDVNANWNSGADASNVTLVQNPNCTRTGAEVTLQYDLGKTVRVNGVSLSFYHCADMMIGYPAGDVTVLYSADGKNYTEIGTYALADAEVARGSYGTVTTAVIFDTVEASYIRITYSMGSNKDVLGSAADGKRYWEFTALTEVALSDADVHEHVYTEQIIKEPTLSSEGERYCVCSCGGSFYEVISAVSAQPDELTDLPDGAYALDYAGYKHAGAFSIVAGDNMTVYDLTALGNGGAAKDMNYAYIIVVGADHIVTQVWYELGVAKSDVVCPEGGYIISYNGNKSGYQVLADVKVGDFINLINIDIGRMSGVEGNQALANAGFTIGEPVTYERGDINGDGAVNANDYIRLKRHILRTYKLTDDEYGRADVNNDGTVNSNDYVMLKRVILGTYKFV